MKPVRFWSDLSPVADRRRPVHFAALINSVAAALALMAVPTPSQAWDQLPLGQNGNYAVFELGGNGVAIAGSTINGDVAVGSGATFSLDSASTINGTVYNDPSNSGSSTDPNPNIINTGTITGGINSSTSLSQAVTDAPSTVTIVGGMTPAQSFNGLYSGTTVSGTAGLNVISVSNGLYLSGAGNNLTISGSASDQFVFNVSGGLALGDSASIVLTGGVTANNVLFVVNGATNISQTTASGTFLDLNNEVSLVGGTLNGAVLSANAISIQGTIINGTGNEFGDGPVTAPEMNTMAMASYVCLLLLGKAGWDRMRKRSRIRSRSIRCAA